MHECPTCGDDAPSSIICRYCGIRHCISCRLPETHDCFAFDPREGLYKRQERPGWTDEPEDRHRRTPSRTRPSRHTARKPKRLRRSRSSSNTDSGPRSQVERGRLIKHSRRQRKPSLTRTQWAIVLGLLLVSGLIIGAVYIGEIQPFRVHDASTGVGSSPAGGTTPGTVHDEIVDSIDNLDREQIESSIIDEVNEIRVSRGIGSLQTMSQLNSASEQHSQRMVEYGFFDHDDIFGNGPFDRAMAANAPCELVGENLAITYFDEWIQEADGSITAPLTSEGEIATDLVDAWMDSPGHRENLLHREWDWIGVGVAFDNETNEVYATQKFCA